MPVVRHLVGAGSQPPSAAPCQRHGRLLAPMVKDATLLLREEEVPREGARTTRAYQLTAAQPCQAQSRVA